MTILCIETSTSVCSAAICKDGAPIRQCINQEGSNHARLLPLYIEELLSFARQEGLTIEALALSEGPGSYTGVRIGMTMAKVLGSLMNRDVYTLSTLQLYAGLEDCYVIMDARAKRVYVGRYKDGKPLMEDTIYTNDRMKEIIDSGANVIGDLHLFGQEDRYGDLAQHFADLREFWQKVDNVDLLTPTYLKSSEEYLK
ncbi:MAG: tRNA (adenosine(37)-N6)-threonylcarbamoyltransferase complex dimerization subunit type 1 TsaB [Firmicutes bacterium]|nr:tRNA (adenosine(37)-N6)-threonylcarbamoyltransferase complex dimerization subunit type 1 TsaB [Bacillota bacterium]